LFYIGNSRNLAGSKLIGEIRKPAAIKRRAFLSERI